MKGKGNYIGGAWRKAKGAVVTSVNPAQPKEVLFEQETAVTAVDEAVEAAHHAFGAWRRKSIDERADLLFKLRDAILRDAHGLAEAVAREAGKALWESHTEISALRAKIDITVNDCRRDIELSRLADGTGFVSHHPHGVMAVLGPFNFPLSLSHAHIVPGLLAGNTVVLKPSEQTPGVAQRYAELIEQVGFPPGVFNLVQGAGDVGQALGVHRGVRALALTGSYAVGHALQQANLDQPHKLLALEMGGKNSIIVMPDAAYGLALYETVFSGFVSAGQRCAAASRVIVVDRDGAFFERFVGDLKRIAAGIEVGDPFDPKVFMGPLVSARAREQFVKGAADLAKHGQEIVPTRPLPGDGFFATPQVVVADAGKESPYFREELFGPSLTIFRAASVEDAMLRANDTDYGLALAVFSADREVFDTCLVESRAGVVNWNKGTVGAQGKLPFGGIGKSGNFRPAGSFSLRYATYPVATVIGESLPKPEMFPPDFPREGIVA